MRVEGDELVVGPFEGSVCDPAEGDEFTVCAADFLLRTLALDLAWPAPLPGDGELKSLALFCMSQFSRGAHYAALEPPPREVSARLLRVMSRLHLAVLRGDVDGARAALDAGVPVDLRDRLGAPAIHYVTEVGPMLALLAERGADLDAESDALVRLLMMAVRTRSLPLVTWLLARGAVADAADGRGFTALHRAAEMGEAAIVDALRACSADPTRAAAGGHTPVSLAETRGHGALAERLRDGR